MKLISDEDLIHAGVPGMKWGFNKGRKNGKREATSLDILRRNNIAKKRLDRRIKKASRNLAAKTALSLKRLGRDLETSINRADEDYRRFADRQSIYYTFGRKPTKKEMAIKKRQDKTRSAKRKVEDSIKKLGRKISDKTGLGIGLTKAGFKRFIEKNMRYLN